jgi:Ni,Fe-hydrogenase maturation factor
MPADQVLGLAGIVRPGLPPGSFVGIGGASFGLGEGLSPAVERAIPRFAQAIAAEIERLRLDEGAV